MRVHCNYDQFQMWAGVSDAADFVSARNLVAARLEPVIRQMLGHTTLDLVFKLKMRYVTVPLIIVDSAQLVLREADRLIWPAAIAQLIDDGMAIEIETVLAPWLRSLTTARALDSEQIRHFGNDADRGLFEQARAANIVGASPLDRAVNALGPYVYGARFVSGKNVLVAGANDGVQGAAFLSRTARAVRTGEMDAGQTELEAHWFPAREESSAPAEVLFVGPGAAVENENSAAIRVVVDAEADSDGAVVCAAAFPLDILFTYDTFHGPAMRTFSVSAREQAVGARPMPVGVHRPVGGSQGRILFGLRKDWESAPDADCDSAIELAALLRDEGFTVDICVEASRCDFASYDIVHCFNVLEARSAAGFLARAKQAGIRTVSTANFTDVSGGQRAWGAATAPVCFTQEIDEAYIQQYLSFFARRGLLTEGWHEGVRRGPEPGHDELVREVLSLCDAVIAESAMESTLLRTFGYSGDIRVVAPFLHNANPDDLVRAPVEFQKFALLHAPVEPRNNQLLLVRAAREANMPLVLAGDVRDMAYAARVREMSDSSVVILGATAPQTDWLYANADIVVDAAWYAYGTQRLLRGALSGARMGVSEAGWGPALLQGAATVDPARLDSMAAALVSGAALPHAERRQLAESLEPGSLLRNVLRAYTGTIAEPLPA